MKSKAQNVFFVVVLGLLSAAKGGDHFGVVHAEDSETGNKGLYCMMYNPNFHSIPADPEEAPLMPLADLTPDRLCDDPPKPPDVEGKMVAVSRGNCTFSEKSRNIQNFGGKAALIVSSTGLNEPRANSTADHLEVNISVALMLKSDFQKLQDLGKKIQAKLYAPEAPRVDFNFILIWVIAVGTVVIGAFWSGLVKEKQRLRKIKILQGRTSESQNPSDEQTAPEEEEETFDVSPKFIIIFVIMMCAMLVSLYFLYDYLVYFIIALFTIASSTALYSCLKLLLIRMPCIGECRIPPNRIPLLSQQPEIRRIFLGVFCLAIGIWWAVERKKDYAWILQDILGVVFCIHMLKTVRLSSLRACTILLVLLFFYDIFFVFITPLLTKTGQSIMVDVATGGDSSTGEMLPMVFKVPRFANSVLSVCSLPFSLLGFGDILIPGLLVAYCHGFDLKVKSKRIYFISTSIAYGVGLIITFIALAFMNSGQPALLYLVPCTLLAVTAVGAKRGELPHLWRGELLTSRPTNARGDEPVATATTEGLSQNGEVTTLPRPPSVTMSSVQENGGETASGIRDRHNAANGLLCGGDPTLENSSMSSDNEQQYLIQR